MKKRIKRLGKSFRYAHSGLSHALLTQPNLVTHLVLGAIVCIAAWIAHFDHIEWAILILVIALVIILEMINTVAEAIVDLASPEFSDQARIAKDVSAGAVLVAAIFSIIVGLILFGHHI